MFQTGRSLLRNPGTLPNVGDAMNWFGPSGDCGCCSAFDCESCSPSDLVITSNMAGPHSPDDVEGCCLIDFIGTYPLTFNEFCMSSALFGPVCDTTPNNPNISGDYAAVYFISVRADGFVSLRLQFDYPLGESGSQWTHYYDGAGLPSTGGCIHSGTYALPFSYAVEFGTPHCGGTLGVSLIFP